MQEAAGAAEPYRGQPLHEAVLLLLPERARLIMYRPENGARP